MSVQDAPDPQVPLPRGPVPVAPPPRPRRMVELTIDGQSVAVPEGATLLETQWETAHRSAWRHLHRLVQDGASGTDLAGFARDVFTLRTTE